VPVNDALGVPGFDDAKDEVGVGDFVLVIELFLDSLIINIIIVIIINYYYH